MEVFRPMQMAIEPEIARMVHVRDNAMIRKYADLAGLVAEISGGSQKWINDAIQDGTQNATSSGLASFESREQLEGADMRVLTSRYYTTLQ